MFIFFSILVVLSPLVAVVSAISAARKKETKAKRILAISAALFVISFVGCAITAPPVNKTEQESQMPTTQDVAPEQLQKPAQSPVPKPKDTSLGNSPEPPKTQSAAPEESQKPAQSSVPKPEDTSLGNSPEPPKIQSAAPEESQKPAQSSAPGLEDASKGNSPTALPEPTGTSEVINPLSTLTVQEHPVMNGLKTERIGTWASVATTKEFMSGVTDQQLYDYLTGIEENDYNWFNIFFEDGTGLDFATALIVTYGPIDQEEGGSVSMSEGRSFMYDYESKTYQEQGKGVDETTINEALVSEIPQSFQESRWFQAYALATGTTNNSASVSMQIDQGSDSQDTAQELVAQFYEIAKNVVEDTGCTLESFDIVIVNNGSPVGLYATQDGKAYTLIKNGKRTEVEI